MGHAGKAALALAAWLAGMLPGLAAEPVAAKLELCLACHGAEGRSQVDNVPSLGAQPAPYTLIQLFMFRERLRLVEPMNDMARELSDDDLRAMAGAIAALPAPRPETEPADPARLDRARALAEQHHCNVCHRPDYAGQESVPRLAQQREDYLLKTLREYKSGARRGYEATMAEIMRPLDDAQIVELSYYLAHLR